MLKELLENIKKMKKRYILLIILAVILITSFIIYKFVFNEKIQYTIVNGYIEKVSENQALVALKEDVMDLDINSSIVPIIEEGKRVSKNEVMAIYKNSEYEEYLNKINQMDSQIETLIKDLPSTYSADVSAIDDEISKLTIESMKITSYVKMQEYKTKIDELSEKKVSLLSELSPAGSKIRDLIKTRQNYDVESKSSSNNIRANVGGLVSYKIDGIENYIDFENIQNITIDQVNNYYNKYSDNSTNNFGIKIVDNYKAYIMIKEKKGGNDEYITLNKRYRIRLIDDNYKEIIGTVIVNLKDEEYNYVIFEITNNIEDIYHSRYLSVEVVWKRIENLAVPNSALKFNEEKSYYYVLALKYGNYVEIPVKLMISSDNISIITKMDDEEKTTLDLKSVYDVKLYDRIVAQ